MKRIVFDLDDTISVHRNRDYENAAPVAPVIERMRELRRDYPEIEIVIHTARGMVSCNGDMERAAKKNRPIIEAWLQKHEVPYDQIVFGKPFADAYVDDKAVSLEEWTGKGVKTLEGYSGKRNYRVGNIVVKADEHGDQHGWYKAASAFRLHFVTLPTVISWSFGKLFLRFIDGHSLSNISDSGLLAHLPNIVAAIRELGSNHVEGENNIDEYCELVKERGEAACMRPDRLEALERELRQIAPMLKRTFCHGDFTLANLISRKADGVTGLIDPSFKQFFSTYLLDAAKFRASMTGLNAVVTGSPGSFELSLKVYDRMWTDKEKIAVRVLERSNYVRVAGMAAKMGKMEDAERLLNIEGAL